MHTTQHYTDKKENKMRQNRNVKCGRLADCSRPSDVGPIKWIALRERW